VGQGANTATADLGSIAALVEAGDLAAAERELRRMLAVADSAAARDLLGVILVRAGDRAAAERELRRALELEADHFPARVNLGRLLLQQQRLDEAKRELQAAARLAPLDRELSIALARLEIGSGEIGRGEGRLRAAAEGEGGPGTRLGAGSAKHSARAAQGSAHARFELARSLARRGENREALAELERALELAPNAEDLLSARARVLLALQTPVPAIETLAALTRMHPEVAEHAYLLGVARLQIAETTTGIEALQRSLELDPRQPLAHIALGLAFKEQKEYARAKDSLLASLQLLPGNVDALVALAEAEEALGELELAERRVERTLELAADAPAALYVLGKIRMTEGRYEEARDALRRAVERDPRLAKAHYQLSLAYARLGDRESSQQHLELYRRAQELEEKRLTDMLGGAEPHRAEPEPGGPAPGA